MARHTPDVDAREIDADRARGRTIGTAMAGDEWLATHEARRRVIRRQGGVYVGQTPEVLDELVRAEHERAKGARR